jgi:hypothetical protein
MMVVLMVVAAGAAFMVVLMVVAAGTAFVMLVAGCRADGNVRFHLPGGSQDLGQKSVGILGGEVKLLGSEDNIGIYDTGDGADLRFRLGGAMGAIQVADGIDFGFHMQTS